MKLSQRSVFLLILAQSLAACDQLNFEAVKLCKEAMVMNVTQLQAGDKALKKFQNACWQQASTKTVAQWQCIVTEMKAGKTLRDATDKCVIANPVAPAASE